VTPDSFQDWALRQLEAQVKRNMPAAKAARQLKADNRDSRKAMARARRSLANAQAASKRKLNERLVLLEQESRARQNTQDAESDLRLWNLLLLGHGRPGV